MKELQCDNKRCVPYALCKQCCCFHIFIVGAYHNTNYIYMVKKKPLVHLHTWFSTEPRCQVLVNELLKFKSKYTSHCITDQFWYFIYFPLLHFSNITPRHSYSVLILRIRGSITCLKSNLLSSNHGSCKSLFKPKWYLSFARGRSVRISWSACTRLIHLITTSLKSRNDFRYSPIA